MKIIPKCQTCRRLLRFKYDSFMSRYMKIIWRSPRQFKYEFQEEEPEFLEWLKQRYDETPAGLYLLCQATGSYGDYNALMEWYRRRYRKEIKLGRALNLNNPFKNTNQED